MAVMNTVSLPAPYRLEQTSPLEGLDRIWFAGLMVSDAAVSQVIPLADPKSDLRAQVLAAWLVVDETLGEDIGMALVSHAADPRKIEPVLNLYVRHDRQNRGIGEVLARAAQAAYPQMQAYYTLDSVRLYQKLGLAPAFIELNDDVRAVLREQGQAAAQQRYILQVLDERDTYDRQVARYRQRRPG